MVGGFGILSAMTVTATACAGTRVDGLPCENTTTNPSGWCGQCAGVAGPAGSVAADPAVAAAGPGADPLAAGPVPDADGKVPCGQCGAPTGRKSGLCRKHDPKHKTGGGGAAQAKKPTVPVDLSAAPVPADEVAQCGFGFVPAAKGETRRCRNAVRSPETVCHRHGGDPGMSFAGKTYAKAMAEAERGELRPVDPGWWDGAEARYEALEGQVAAMLATDTSRLADMYARLSAHQSTSGVGRFSTNNQMLVLFQHLAAVEDDFDDPDAALDAAFARMAEPHMTAANWAKEGREPLPDASPVAVMHYKPAGWVNRDADDTDEDWEAKLRGAAGHRRYLAQFPLSSTAGDPYTAPPSPLAEPLPAAHGNPAAVVDDLVAYAESQGITVAFADTAPHGAEGVYQASKAQITVWSGTGSGDPAARAHVLAHEIGHAVMGHGTDASAEDRRPDREAAAETFAYLVTARYGIHSAEMSAWYVNHWQPNAGVNMAAGSSAAALKSAIVAADDLFAAAN